MAQTPEQSALPSIGPRIGIEIADGGMRLAATLANSSAPFRRHHLSTPPSPEEALVALNEVIGQVLGNGGYRSDRLAALGVALWGDIDPLAGVTLGMPHVTGWEGFPLAERLADRWQARVHLQSAVAAAGLAEATAGAGRKHKVVLYLHSGRTVASALIVNGALVPGASGRAGKLGHWQISQDGPRCACGMRGHLDPIASAQSIVRATIGLASGSDASTAAMLRVSHGRAEAMTVRQVIQLASEGDPSATTVMDAAWDALAVVLANLSAALDPEIIVIGGPAGEAGEIFSAPLHERLTVLCDSWRPTPAVVPGTLDPRAPLLGACLLAQSGEPNQVDSEAESPISRQNHG